MYTTQYIFILDMILSESPSHTINVAQQLALCVVRHPPKLGSALVVGLNGELGAGKTVFAQGFAKGLGVQHTTPSPTFVLMREYELSNAGPYSSLAHLDLYRLKIREELEVVDWHQKAQDPGVIAIVEWASPTLSKNELAISVSISHADDETRKIDILSNIEGFTLPDFLL